MRISDWSSDVCSSDLHRHRHGAAVTLGQDAADHRLEIVDIAVHLVAELGLFLIMPQDGLGLAAVEQADGAAREDAAITLQIGRPSRVRHLVRHRSEEHTSELQSLMRNSYAVFCLNKKKHSTTNLHNINKSNK